MEKENSETAVVISQMQIAEAEAEAEFEGLEKSQESIDVLQKIMVKDGGASALSATLCSCTMCLSFRSFS